MTLTPHACDMFLYEGTGICKRWARICTHDFSLLIIMLAILWNLLHTSRNNDNTIIIFYSDNRTMWLGRRYLTWHVREMRPGSKLYWDPGWHLELPVGKVFYSTSNCQVNNLLLKVTNDLENMKLLYNICIYLSECNISEWARCILFSPVMPMCEWAVFACWSACHV